MSSIALLAFTTLRAQPPGAWLKDGKPVADTESMRSKGGFGAQLFLTENAKLFEDWNKPETPRLNPAKVARRNVPIFVVILFVNPGTDAAGRAKVTSHVVVRAPDGKVYAEQNPVGWSGKYTLQPHNLQLAQDYVGIRIEPKDLAGNYVVAATVRDDIKKVDLHLKTTFTVAK